jgi:hypothetical protein
MKNIATRVGVVGLIVNNHMISSHGFRIFRCPVTHARLFHRSDDLCKCFSRPTGPTWTATDGRWCAPSLFICNHSLGFHPSFSQTPCTLVEVS